MTSKLMMADDQTGRRSSFHPIVIITEFNNKQVHFAKKKLLEI